jgi:hypothetical protein
MALIRLPTQIERLVILGLIVIVGTFKIFRIFGPVATLAQLKPAMIFLQLRSFRYFPHSSQTSQRFPVTDCIDSVNPTISQ